MRAWIQRLLRACAVVCLCAPSFAQQDSARSAWTPRTLEVAGELIVQDGGRLKPLSTLANFSLLGISGKRSYTDERGQRRSAVEFVLDTLYFPKQAAEAPIFLINDSAVAQALELQLPEKKKRDRYSFHEIEPGLPRLFSLAHDYGAIDAKLRNSVQAELVLLAERVDMFLRLNRQETLALIPPDDGAAGELAARWLAPAHPMAVLARGEKPSAERQRVFDALDALANTRTQPEAFETRMAALKRVLDSFAAVQVAKPTVALELRYYRLAPLSWGLGLFSVAFLCAACGWLRPNWKWLQRTTLALASGGSAALVLAIVLRCVIRSRPPVSTLYETVLFITAVGVLVGLALEWFNRQRLAGSVSAFAGMVGLFIANGYETLDAKDTMPSLVAVLDTNFWLATHVTAITIGYAAGLFAALLGSVYILAKLLRPARMTQARFRSLSGMVYGVLCFGLIFSTVGTILGGIWANESWGRFWGWDPKENGALLIVISQLVILHARKGGFLREFGVAIAGAAAGCVVAFSWWGVNLLGVGLHSYGFTSGIQSALSSYYAIQGSIVLLGLAALWRERRAKRAGLSAQSPTVADHEKPPGARRAA
jgi:ABC-type transport system involved in cytochrome c biogenesis permease subunit